MKRRAASGKNGKFALILFTCTCRGFARDVCLIAEKEVSALRLLRDVAAAPKPPNWGGGAQANFGGPS